MSNTFFQVYNEPGNKKSRKTKRITHKYKRKTRSKKQGGAKMPSRKFKRKTRSRQKGGDGDLYYNIVEAIERGNSILLEKLLSRGDAHKYVNMENGIHYGPPLVRASAIGNSAKDIKNIIHAGADVNANDDNGDTALIIASENGYTDIMKILLDAGADVNVKNKDGDTALMLTTERLRNPEKRKEIISTLLDAGADVNAKNKRNNTALFIAIRRGYKDLVKILLNAGADVNARTNYNETPLILANDFEYPEIVTMLEEAIEIRGNKYEAMELVRHRKQKKSHENSLRSQAYWNMPTTDTVLYNNLYKNYKLPPPDRLGGKTNKRKTRLDKKRTKKNHNNKLR